MAVVAPSPTHHQTLSGELDADVGIVREIIEELDRERNRRAELEAQVRRLLAEKEQQEDEFTISRKHYMALQTELQGYRDLIEAITMERPAIREALAVSTRQKMVPSAFSETPPSLPLHVIRLLEIMPWDPRASEYAFAKEEMFEWQFYDARQQTWLTELRKSPSFFGALPVEEPKPGVNAESVGIQRDRPILAFLGNNDSAPPSSCVLTNQGITKLYNLKEGYPLPENGGTWQWVGAWRVEKRITMNEYLSSSTTQQSASVQQEGSGTRRQKIDCDDEGWSYAMETTHFLLNPTETCWDNPGITTGDKQGTILRPVRRRKWIRQRALVDYPHASESTRYFLSLMAQRTYATMAANKISEQLVDTKVALTEAEAVLLQCKDETARQVRVLNEVLAAKGKARITQEETKFKIKAASDAANQMQEDVVKALHLSSREKNCPASPL